MCWSLFLNKFRSSREHMFFKIVDLKNFANFTGSSHRSCYVWKGVLRNFAKSTGLTRATLSDTGVFLWILQNFYEHLFNRIALSDCFWPYFTDHLQWLLLTVSGFERASLLKKRSRQRCFSVNFVKFVRTFFEKTRPDHCFLSLSVNFEKFFRTPLSYITSEKLLSWCTSCRISTSRCSEKLFHRCFSSILGKNEK